MGVFDLIRNFIGAGKDSVNVTARSLHDFSIKRSDTGEVLKFSDFKGKVMLCSNVASKCGLTDEMYDVLGSMAAKFSDDLIVLAFPCDQFMKQEFNDPSETCSFVSKKLSAYPSVYGKSLILTEKVNVNGTDSHPIFQFLKFNSSLGSSGGKTDPISWNFGKFLVDREGRVVRYFGPKDSQLESGIADVVSGKLVGSDPKIFPK